MDALRLSEVLENHCKWRRGEGGERANLAGAKLAFADLSFADLSFADLSFANLEGANLSFADLSFANLKRANLALANLECANLEGANLAGANLAGAYLERADLAGANLDGANLDGANLARANLPESKHGCVCRLDFGVWSVCVYHDLTQIECQIHPNAKWLELEPDAPELVAMHEDASEWWAVHGDIVKAAIRCVMAKAANFGE